MVAITVQVDDAQVRAAFNRLVQRGENPHAYLGAIGDALANSTRLRFHDGKGPSGLPWRAVLRGGRPLRNTGVHLMNAVSHRVEGNSVRVGVPPAWGSVHQFGATIRAKGAGYLRFRIGQQWVSKKSVTIPARPFLGISLDDRAEIVDILRSRLLEP
jgi:phage virion morphogenesis protein